MRSILRFASVIFISFLCVSAAQAKSHTVNLEVTYKNVSFNGQTKQAISVNNQIPAPTLHFKEGDEITLNVHNHLDKETAIHWHGIILPWQMDGVLGVTQNGILPGESFQYKFTLNQSGTYWYHAHAGLQEQQGLYGAFLIDPIEKPKYKYTKDYTVVLSDWIDTHPDQVLANLKKDGSYYSPKFPLQPSLLKFINDYRKGSAKERKKVISDYMTMQQMRMSIYDISDIAYDAFLLNGNPNSNPWTAPVKVGDVVRLRFIGAGGSSIFHVKIPNATMQMVHVQGNDIKPYEVKDFTVASGETFDVLVKIEKDSPYIIYAESTDTVGAAYGALVTTPNQIVNYKQVSPFPEPPPVTREMMSMMMPDMNKNSSSMNMENKLSKDSKKIKKSMSKTMKMDSGKPMDHSKMSMPMDNSKMNIPIDHSKMSMPMSQMNMSTDHSNMSMQTEPSIIGDVIKPSTTNKFYTTSGTKYQNLKAAVKTNDPSKPVDGVINMELFGYMDRYIWYINGVPGGEAKPIILEPNKRYRIVFTNKSMMHHPMHIHGHWFILRKGNGEYDPLLHTIDVAPGATITADLDADASGQWFFHCHMLYHMITGMSRAFQYETLIDITKNITKPQNIIEKTPYYNRPIVRVDALKPIDTKLVYNLKGHPVGLYLASFLDVGFDPRNNSQQLTYNGLFGPKNDRLEIFIDDAELKKGKIDNANIDIFYWRLISQFWAVKAGANYFYRPSSTPYWQPGIGIEGLTPYFIDTNLRVYYHDGSFKADLELSRDTQLTNNFFVRTGLQGVFATKTLAKDDISSGLNNIAYTVRAYYRVAPGLSVFSEYEYEQDYGTLKKLNTKAGEATNNNTLSLGVSVLF